MRGAARTIEPMCEPEAGVALTPEGEFVCRIAQTDGDLRNGSAITWEEPYEEREPVSPRRLDDDIQQWLGRVYELCGASEIDPALDLVLDEVDDLLYPGGDVAPGSSPPRTSIGWRWR
jgi:hypothetical protein